MSQLSDGEQRLFSLFVDIARRLSLQSRGELLGSGEAIVMIDEIDVHLHPKWQRQIVPALEDLFQNCQFIATSHSPFIVQATQPGRVQHIGGRAIGDVTDRGIEEIAKKAMGVDGETGVRYLEELEAAKRYLRALTAITPSEKNRVKTLREELAELSSRYARNPAYQAYLELKTDANFPGAPKIEMKPVDKGQSLGTLADYKEAKRELLKRIGLHCSYCEQPGPPQNLHVEHIYPRVPHPEFEREWDNFLVACSTCNTYKHHHLGSNKQTDLEGRYVWPHRDNTLRAFEYFDDGRVEIPVGVTGAIRQAAVDTLEMIGAMKSPAAAAKYDDDIAYDGMEKRKEIWEIASESLQEYLAANGNVSPNSLARRASKMGHFNIWMIVFHDCPEVRAALICHFKAASSCFGPESNPLVRGRI